jgi:hypothetical protein
MRFTTRRAGAVGGLIAAVMAGAVLTAPAAIAGTAPSPPIDTPAAEGVAVLVGAPASIVATRGAQPSVAGTACAACDLRHGPLELPEPEPEPELYAGSSRHSITLSGLHFSTQSYARVKLDIWTYEGHRHVLDSQVGNDYVPMIKNGSFFVYTGVDTCYGDPNAYAVARDDVTGFTAEPVPVRVGRC